jgi:arginase
VRASTVDRAAEEGHPDDAIDALEGEMSLDHEQVSEHPEARGATVSWELTGIPYTSARDPGGIADAIKVLRGVGLAERLGEHGVADAGDLELLPPSGERGASGLLNEAAFKRLVDATHVHVHQVHKRRRRPLLVGGDCPVLLGALAALGGERGLVMLDGHEDAWPPPMSETGEGSDSELGIALGLFPENMPPPLDRWGSLLGPSNVALLGPRDSEAMAIAGVRSISEEVAFFRDDRALLAAEPGAVIAEALAAIVADTFWLHIDLDVLATDAFSAVDYPQPAGLGWHELEQLAAAAAADPRCQGVSVVIYNPDLDPNRDDANRVVDFLARLVQRTLPSA